MIDVDRYPGLGTRETFSTFEEVIARVRKSFPRAVAEGSTGSERSWVISLPDGDQLVAHSWSPRGRLEKFHVRVRK